MADDNSRALRAPLPSTLQEFLPHRKVKIERTLNDLVEEIHLKLYEEDEYRAFLEAVYDEEAIEGSLAIDNSKAAEMIRKYAQTHDNTIVAGKKLATIVKSMGVIMRRYSKDRKQRRNMLHGEIVPNPNDD